MSKQLQVEYIKVEDLQFYERNTRTHSDEQIASLCESIKEFGFTNPVLIDEDGVLIAGHGRTTAAKSLGLKEVPAIRLVGLSEAQRKALRIADNKLALDAGWDLDLLASELQDIGDLGFDLDLTGFSLDELEGMLNGGADSAEGGDDSEDEDDDRAPDEDKPSNFKYEEKYAVLVECEDEAEQADIYAKLKDMGLTCKVLVN